VTVLQLHKPKPCDDIVDGLRKLADRIEAGEHGLISTAIVCLGHTFDSEPDSEGFVSHCSDNELFGYGPRCDTFTVRGLLLTCAGI
jgi:hypothetical protein